MKMDGLAAAVMCIAVIGAMWMEWPEPAGDQVWAYQKLQPADYRLLRSDALGFVTAKAHEGFELHARHAGATSFEIRCKGVVVIDVENAPSRVLIGCLSTHADGPLISSACPLASGAGSNATCTVISCWGA